jgi:ribonuclease G
LRSRVWLKSGGFIVINQTEALVAIDVNTGKYVGRGRHEETIVRTNLEAVREIVRQIRLRNLGGFIVIDLIDMQEPASRATVLEALERELRKDRARCRMLPISEFGLVEITRQRMRPGLDGVMCRPCPACGGAGRTKSFETLASEIVREVRSRGAALLEHRTVIRAHPEAAAALRERGAVLLAEIGCAAGGLEFEGDPGLRPDQWILRVD